MPRVKVKSEYELQAEAFLTKHQLAFSILSVSPECPSYCDDTRHTHGKRYLVQLTGQGKPRSKPLIFPFWNSYNDEYGPKGLQFGPNFYKPKPPTAYGVLACIALDVHCPDTFAAFCDEFGCDSDSRKALAHFEHCSMLAQQLRAFFTAEEIADLQEIQ